MKHIAKVALVSLFVLVLGGCGPSGPSGMNSLGQGLSDMVNSVDVSGAPKAETVAVPEEDSASRQKRMYESCRRLSEKRKEEICNMSREEREKLTDKDEAEVGRALNDMGAGLGVLMGGGFLK